MASHLYCINLDIKELNQVSGKYLRRTKIVNLYDNKIGRGCVWQGSSSTIRRAIQDILWRSIIQGRVLIIGDMNAHSSMWNPHCRQSINAGPLEELIETYELIINNDTEFPTRPASPGISIIDLALTSPQLGPLRVWEIAEEYPSLSDHELILMEWEDIDTQSPKNIQAAMSGWSIKNLLENDMLFQAAKSEWKKTNGAQQHLDLLCTKQELDKKVK